MPSGVVRMVGDGALSTAYAAGRHRGRARPVWLNRRTLASRPHASSLLYLGSHASAAEYDAKALELEQPN